MKTGLVLSGGMAKGAFQAGALRAISERISPEKFSCISATSVGTLNAYAFLNGRLDELDEAWRDICNDGARHFVGQVSKSSMVQSSIRRIYKKTDKIDVDFYTTLWDLKRRSAFYKNLSLVQSTLLPEFMKASVAIPLYNKSVLIEGHDFYDGGTIDNIPVFPITKHDVDLVICIHFDESLYMFENEEFDKKVLNIVFPSKNLVKQTAVFEKAGIEEMIGFGYSYTKDLLDIVFAGGEDNIEHIYKTIALLKKGEGERSLRITSEIVMSNINKLTQKLIKRKVIL